MTTAELSNCYKEQRTHRNICYLALYRKFADSYFTALAATPQWAEDTEGCLLGTFTKHVGLLYKFYKKKSRNSPRGEEKKKN